MTVIPNEAQKYLKHLPTISGWIRSNKKISGVEMIIFKTAYGEVYRFLKQFTYDKIREVIYPYQNDPQYGQYVRQALSYQGEQWIRYALDLIHQS